MSCEQCAALIAPINKTRPLVYRCAWDLHVTVLGDVCPKYEKRFEAPPKEESNERPRTKRRKA